MITALTKVKAYGGITKYVKDLKVGNSILTHDLGNGMCLYSKVTRVERCVAKDSCFMVNIGKHEFICEGVSTEILVNDSKGFQGMLRVEQIGLDTNNLYNAIRSVGKPLPVKVTNLEHAIPLYIVETEAGNLIINGVVISYREPVNDLATIHEKNVRKGYWDPLAPFTKTSVGSERHKEIEKAYNEMAGDYVVDQAARYAKIRIETSPVTEKYVVPTGFKKGITGVSTGRLNMSTSGSVYRGEKCSEQLPVTGKEVYKDVSHDYPYGGLHNKETRDDNNCIVRSVYAEESDDWEERMSYYKCFGFTKKAFGDISWRVRREAYRELGYTEKAFSDADPEIRLEAYRKLGFTEGALSDINPRISKGAEEYFKNALGTEPYISGGCKLLLVMNSTFDTDLGG